MLIQDLTLPQRSAITLLSRAILGYAVGVGSHNIHPAVAASLKRKHLAEVCHVARPGGKWAPRLKLTDEGIALAALLRPSPERYL